MNGLEQVRDTVLREARAPVPLRPWQRLVWALVAVHALVALASLAAARFALGSTIEGGWAPVAVVAAFVVVALRAAVSPAVSISTPVAAALGVAAAAASIAGAGGPEAASWGWEDMRCSAAEVAMFLPLAAAVLAVLRRFAPRRRRSLLAGLAAGAVGLLVLHLACPVNGPWHTAVFHVAPWVALAGALAFLRPRLASRSFAP